MAGEHRWIFTREEIANTPSRKCGIDSEKELNYRQQAANLIQDMGQRLSVSQLCINTAIVYMHRFYMFHSFTKFHRNAIASAGLFLAAKVEEQPRKLEHVIKVCHMLLNTKGGGQLDVKSEQYLAEAHDLVSNENVLLQTLGFDITVDHPHGHVVRTCTLVKASKDLAQTSYFLATNSLHLTQMCLIYKPTVVACVCMHLACKWSDYQIPRSSEGKEWFSYVDREVTSELLEELTGEFLAILDRCPSKLKRKILNWKAGGREDQMGGGSPSMGMSAPPPPPPPDRHRHRPAPSATQSSANQEHHAKQHGAPPPSSEGMRRVQTEPANLVNTSSITPKEYLQRHQKKKVDDGRERHHHGLPQHGGTKHDFPDGAPVRRPHDPNAPHGHHRRPSSSQSSQHKRHPSQSHSAPDAKKPTVEGEQPPPPPPPPVPTQEPKERSNIFDKMQLETSNTSTPEPLLDHQSIKESLEIDLMDMSKDASLPTPAKKDMNSLKSSSSIIPKSSNPREKHPPSISKMQDPSQILSNLKTQGASQALSLSVGAADSKEKVVAGSFKHFPDKSEKLDKEAEQIRRPLPQTHRERHPHSSHRKPSGPKSVQKPIADMTAFEKALVMSTPKETKSGLASPTKPMLSSPPSRSNLMSPNQESKDSQEPTTPKEQRIPVERGMLVSSERKQRNRLPSISVEDRTLLESRRGSSPKIILERFDSSDSDTNTSKDNGTKISPKGTPLVKKEPGMNPSELSMRVKREESSKMDSILETDVINEAQTMKVNFSVLEHIKTEGHPNEHSQEKRFSSSIKIESSHSNGRHRHEAHGPPVRKDANVKQEPDVNVKRETSLSFPNELVMKAEPIRPKLLDDIKEPGELSMSPSDYAAGDSASTRFNLSTDLNESVPNFRKKELEAAGLLIEPKVKDSPSSGSLKVTINKTVMSNSPMSDKDVRKEKKEKHRDKDREHRHRDKKHKKHKHHKRSHSPNSGRSHHTSREEPKLEEPTQYPIKKLKITFGSNPGSGSDSERITNVISTDDHKQLPGTTAEASGLKIHFNKDLSGQYISNSSHHKYKKDKDRDRDREKSRKRNRSPSSRSHEGNNPSKISKSESMSTKNLMEYPDPQALQEAKMSVDKAIALLSKNMEAQMGSDSNTLGNMPPLPSGQPQKPPPPPTDLPPVLPPPNPPL